MKALKEVHGQVGVGHSGQDAVCDGQVDVWCSGQDATGDITSCITQCLSSRLDSTFTLL